jgi:hypothetical protein
MSFKKFICFLFEHKIATEVLGINTDCLKIKYILFLKDSKNYLLSELTPHEVEYNNNIHAVVGRPSSMSGNHRNAVDDYTVESSNLNRSLHKNYNGDIKPSDANRARIKKLDELLNKHETHEDAMVFTGLHRSPHEAFHYAPEGEKLVKPISHAEYHMPAYTSTSSNFRAAAKFARAFKPDSGEYNTVEEKMAEHHGGKGILNVNKHIMAINMPAGTKAQSIRHISATGQHEQEVLMHRGHTLEVHHMPTIVEHNGEKHAVWHATVIDHNPKKIEV